MIIEPTYGFGEIVYAKTDPEQIPWIVVELLINRHGIISYRCSHVNTVVVFEEIEITDEKRY